jgi:thiamine-monophosphate kinase
VSDGVVQDLAHVCAASGVGVELDATRLPLSPAYRRAAAALEDPLLPALAGGEDYELLVAVPPARVADAERAARAAGTPLTVVGRFRRGAGVRVLGPDGVRRPAPAGHDHLRAPPRSLTSPRGRLGSAPIRR